MSDALSTVSEMHVLPHSSCIVWCSRLCAEGGTLAGFTSALGQPRVPTQHHRCLSVAWGAWAHRTLQQLGANVAGPTPREFNGLQIGLWPRVSWSPLFALTWDDVEARPGRTASHLRA